MANSGNIPTDETLTGGGAGQNVAPTNSNPALSGAGSFCQLATGISAPIAETIQNTINSLNSLQGAVDGIIYSPAVGINELQRKIASGEILNNITLKIQLAIGQILKNAATSLATSAVTSAVQTLANDALRGVSNAIGDITSPLKDIKNVVTDSVTGVTRVIDQANAQLAAAAYQVADVPGYLLIQAGANVGGAVGDAFITTGVQASNLLGDVVRTTTTALYGVTKSIGSIGTNLPSLPQINPPQAELEKRNVPKPTN